jgi:hypothetical protein
MVNDNGSNAYSALILLCSDGTSSKAFENGDWKAKGFSSELYPQSWFTNNFTYNSWDLPYLSTSPMAVDADAKDWYRKGLLNLTEPIWTGNFTYSLFRVRPVSFTFDIPAKLDRVLPVLDQCGTTAQVLALLQSSVTAGFVVMGLFAFCGCCSGLINMLLNYLM